MLYDPKYDAPAKIETADECIEAIKQRWLAAMRSGKFKFCTAYLHNGEYNCALGVLATIESWPITEEPSNTVKNENVTYGWCRALFGEKSTAEVYTMNDLGKSYPIHTVERL